jgi:hypothetical protein
MARRDKRDTRKKTFLLAVAAAALILVPSATSQAGPPYQDPSGDGGSAGDVTGVTVIGDKTSGQLIFRVSGTNLSTAPNMLTELFIDSDANPDTGNLNWDGADYVLAVDNSTFDFEHWNGSDWVETPYSTVRVCCVGGGSSVMFSVNKSELGNTSEFNLLVRSRNSDTSTNDDAPDDGMYNYSLAAGGPDIQGVMVMTTPSFGPRAGKRFVVSPVGLKLPPDGAIISIAPPPDSYACHVSLNGRSLTGSGTGGCTIAIPKKKARGKTLTVQLTVNYEGAAKVVSLKFRIG